jgi:CarD family transcriptional regulator
MTWPSVDLEGDRPEAWLLPPDPDCYVGSLLFDPRHGVVEVESIESRERHGTWTEYLTLRVVAQQLRILVPRATADEGVIRRLITSDEAFAVLDELGREPQPTPAWSSFGFAEAQRKMLGRNPLVVAGLVRDLGAKNRGKGLRSTERTLLERGVQLLAAELALALHVSSEQARRRMDDALAAGHPSG